MNLKQRTTSNTVKQIYLFQTNAHLQKLAKKHSTSAELRYTNSGGKLDPRELITDCAAESNGFSAGNGMAKRRNVEETYGKEITFVSAEADWAPGTFV